MPNSEHGSTDHTRIETEVYYSQVLEEVHSMPQEATWREKDSAWKWQNFCFQNNYDIALSLCEDTVGGHQL